MIQKAKNGEKLPVYGDGKKIRELVHVLYHCEANDRVLHKGNVVESDTIRGFGEKRNIEIVNTIIDKMGGEIEYVDDRKGHDWRYAMNTEKIEFELDWEPKISFKEGIEELLNR